jgi:hypothetical protein
MNNSDSFVSLNRSGHRTSDHFTIFSMISEGITDQKWLYFPQCRLVLSLGSTSLRVVWRERFFLFFLD